MGAGGPCRGPCLLQQAAWLQHHGCYRTPNNITDYCCGSFSLVQRDLEATLTADRAAEAADLRWE